MAKYIVRQTGDPERDTFPWSVIQVSDQGELEVNSYTHRQVAEEVADAFTHGAQGIATLSTRAAARNHANYERHLMDDGNMPHDVGVYCECPDCTEPRG